MSLRFYNASYLDEQFNIITDAEIITDGEFIAYAGKRSLKNKCEREIDLKGKLVLPGFINTHAHSPLVLLRGAAENLSLFDWLENIIYPAERKLTEEHIYWGTQLALAESLKHGITCTADMYFFPETIAEVYEKNNVSAVLLGTASDKDSSPKEQEYLYKKLNRKNTRFIPGIHAPYSCNENLLCGMSDLVAGLKCPFNCHLSETLTEVGECTVKHKDMTPPMYLHSLGLFDYGGIAAHCVHTDKDDIKLLAQCGVSVSHNPSSNLKLGSGIAPVSSMLKYGVNVALGTDSAASNNSLDIMREMRLAALLQKQLFSDPGAITSVQALSFASVNGAKALGIKNTGIIKEGFKADMCVLDLNTPEARPYTDLKNNLVFSMDSSGVEYTVCNGKILYEKGSFSLNESTEKIYSQAEKLSENLLGGI